MCEPESAEELAHLLAEANSAGRSIALGGSFSKHAMAGPVQPTEVVISTRRLNRVLQYEPRDLTVSVQAGLLYRELSRVLAERRQMIPLDPPFADTATIGGVLAANQSGPRRRLYGTARDMAIGMTFATMEGKLVQTGGMVVKNVAGLDMGKLIIGSFGTLAAMAVLNFKVCPMPRAARTFVRRFTQIEDAMTARDAALGSILQPAALDLLKTADGYELLFQAVGDPAVLDRYSREAAGAEVVEGPQDEALWARIREFTPAFLAQHPQGAVVRLSCKLSAVGAVLERMPVPAIARAGSGVVYGYFERAEDAAGKGLIEFAPQAFRERNELWPDPGDGLATMQKIKHMLDPEGLLNRGRLYGRI